MKLSKMICRLMGLSIVAVMGVSLFSAGANVLTVKAAEAEVVINETNFPDSIFREYVKQFDTDGNGSFSSDELQAVQKIYVFGSYSNPGNIASLKGIEYFTALDTLYCWQNQLTSLDVSKNTALRILYCYDNQLTSLDVSKNTALTGLVCYDNQLTSLDVSRSTALIKLDCELNRLTSLDVSKNTALRSLYCYDNQLTSLDVSKNTNLYQLDCSNNQLTSFDVSKNTALEDLVCGGNQLTSLNVSSNTALDRLGCDDNQLTSLDVSKNTALTYLSCSSNNISSLDVSGNTALKWLYCEKNNLNSLDVSSNTALTELNCDGNNLSSLDVSRNTALKKLNCSSNNLSSLDVRGNTALEELNCGGNNLSSLDVSSNTTLKKLNCSSNNLSSLDVRGNTALEELNCGGNNLSSLDVSSNTALTKLECNNNTHAIILSAGNTFDMSTLPGMDVSKVSNITGGTIKGNILTVDSGAETITYTYDCGNDITTEFELVVKESISSAKVTLPKSSYTYTGSAITPAVTVTYGGKKLKAGTDYTVAYSNNKTVGKATVTITGKGDYAETVKKTFTIVPASTTVKRLTNKTKGITIKWKKVSEAGGYYIYRSKNGGKFSRIKTITSGKTVSYTDKSATTNGARYQYKIVAYKKVGKTTYKSASSKTKTIYRISAPKIKELRSKSGRKIAVKWTKNKKATGYQIQYATNSKFKKAKTVTVKKASTVSKVIKKLKKNSTYRVRVRAYKKVSGKNYYSAWSSKKSVKVRK